MHPFSDLTATEITAARTLVVAHHQGRALAFKAITLEEPSKAMMVPYLEAEHRGLTAPAPHRLVYVVYYFAGTSIFLTAIVDLTTNQVDSVQRPGVHGNVDFNEVVLVEKAVMADAGVQAAVAQLHLPDHLEVVPEPWGYGTDGVDDDRRIYQVYMFVRDKTVSECNHYARPLAFSAVFDPLAMQVLRIQYLPTGADHAVGDSTRAYADAGGSEYTPDRVGLRADLKDLRVVQPDGPSFAVSPEGVVRWQKWHMRVGFNYREGPVLRDVRYDGVPVFYRVSLSEMTVPYGDPRAPFYRKMAFDLGDVGAGLVANDLQLGCDCLGAIAYMDGLICDVDGQPVVKKNAVCIHEQDNGIGWKHTNYRTNKAFVVRNRELVIQTILTVSNYDYILMYIFNQAGEMEYQVRATGMLSTQAVDPGVSVDYGTVVHPGVLAPHHQHILSLRIDPGLGDYAQGHTVVAQETYPMPYDDASNPNGTGYRAVQRVLAREGGYDLDVETNRTFVIQNPSRRNPVNGAPAGYKLVFPPMQKALAHPDSWNARRAQFADHHLYVTKFREDELFAAGKFTNQSRGGTGIKSWIVHREDVQEQDVVCFVQFGLNHTPRIEDFPVMPVEIVRLHLKPVNFFTKNPALDVPPSVQEKNHSVLVDSCCSKP